MKKITRLTLGAVLLLLILSLVVGCSAGMKNVAPEEPGLNWGYGDRIEDGSMWDQGGESAIPPTDSTGAFDDAAVERKFIQDGILVLRSSDIDRTYESLTAITRSLGGRVASYKLESSGDIRWITMQIALPYGQLSEFMDREADQVTKVETKSVSSQEVTESYYDTKTRIESTENLISHYRTLLAKAENIEETLQVQSRIDDLTRELESLKGRLQLLEGLTSESRVEITIRMETDSTITKPEVTWKTLKWSDVGYLMKSAVQKVGIGIVLGVQYFLVALVYILPVLVLALIITVIVVVRRRKKRKRLALLESEASPPVEE